MDQQKLQYWLALAQIPELTPLRLRKLLQLVHNDAAKAWHLSAQDLTNNGFDPASAQTIIAKIKQSDPSLALAILQKHGLQAITIQDPEYPAQLKEISSPPLILYYKGELPKQSEQLIAVVGTRKPTFYGRQATLGLTKELARAGLTIVSGLALGADTFAHQAALEEGAKTIAILGNGLDTIHPTSNINLAKRILEQGGCVISEFPPGTPPLKQNFPARNRIIAGLSLGVLIAEASEKSGTLITANHALDQNREVFAVPGNIYSPNSSGTNNLLKMGAHVVTSAADILNILNLNTGNNALSNIEIKGDSETEEIILSLLSHEPTPVDELIKSSKLNTSEINSTLTIMEMKGKISNTGGNSWILAR